MKRVCIVEDEPDIANLVARNLRKEQFEVSVFHDGESFLRTLDDELPDLAILDLMLPGIDGLNVCREMKADERTRSVPIIILTAKGTELDILCTISAVVHLKASEPNPAIDPSLRPTKLRL